MRFELWLLLITGFVVANMYYDGALLKKITQHKKYYQMAAVVVGAYCIYWAVKTGNKKTGELLYLTNEYLKYMPIDKSSKYRAPRPLDFTETGAFTTTHDSLLMPSENAAPSGNPRGLSRMLNSGKNSSKRSVSETKKKYVAANQGWKCGSCLKQLPAWFEVDHKIRLEYGGTNHVDNLVALCRDCHGAKTAIENL